MGFRHIALCFSLPAMVARNDLPYFPGDLAALCTGDDFACCASIMNCNSRSTRGSSFLFIFDMELRLIFSQPIQPE